MKKLISLLLALAMMFSLAMPAMAVEITGDTQKDVYATFTPEIAISDIVFTGDTVEYDAVTNTYTVYIPFTTSGYSEVTATMEISGTNLKYYQDAENVFLKSIINSAGLEQTVEILLKNFADVEYQDGKVVAPSEVNFAFDGISAKFSFSNDEGKTYSDEITVDYKVAWPVLIEGETKNGTVTVDDEFIGEGDIVNLIVTPDEGYELGELIVKDNINNEPVDVTDNTFEMPYGGVNITATFKEAVVSYVVYCGMTANGYVDISHGIATAGETVTVEVYPSENYELDTLTVTDADYNDVTVTKVEGKENTYTFTMPASDVSVMPTFKKIEYTITIDENIANGTVTADRETAAYGDTVTLTVEADAKYELDTLTVTYGDGNAVTVNNDNTFTMPASAVTVTAAFKALPVSSAAISWGSLEFVYTDGENGSKDGYWSCAAGADKITVENTGDTALNASVAYNKEPAYAEISGSFDKTSADLNPAAAETFTLTVSGEPRQAIPAGTKVGTVTVTIEKAEDVPTPPASDEIAITGVALGGDCVTLNGTTYTITAPAGESVVWAAVTVSGTNLKKIVDENLSNHSVYLLQNGTPTTGVEVCFAYTYNENDGSLFYGKAIAVIPKFAGKTYDLVYSNDNDMTWTDTGYDVVVVVEEAPNPPAADEGITTAAELKSALEAGGEVKLGSDITLEEYVGIENATALDLNGKTITLQGDGYLSVYEATLSVKNGTIQTNTGSALECRYNSILTMDQCTLQSPDYYALYLIGSTAVITNSTLSGGVAVQYAYTPSVLTAVTNVTITDNDYENGLSVGTGCSATVGFDPTSILTPYYNKGTVTDNGDGTWTVA